MGTITEVAGNIPGYDCIIPKEAASVAEVLKQYGYSTSIFGKWHLAPIHEQTLTGPFDHWPVGLGFEKFYGFLQAEVSSYEPPMLDQTTPVNPYLGRDDYHVSEDITEKMISWLKLQRATNPNRPFFSYLSMGAMHCPHHVWPEYIERFKGKFDQGWDILREEIYKRQLELGVIPEGTTLTSRPDGIPSWEEYPDRYKPVASRLMEVFAGMMAHTDEQVGKLLDALDTMGETENTLFLYITGDNGASAEGTIHGAWSCPSFQNAMPEDPEWLLEHMEDFGSARCENHYNAGWGWALDTPFQWMKQVASHFGGTRNALAVQWPKHILDKGGLRTQFHHVVDIFPTILEAAGISPPSHVNGIPQQELNGVSMIPSFASELAKETHLTQYFEMLGNRAIFHDGWIASCFHGRPPWIRSSALVLPFDGPQEKWELYNVRDDFSQGKDLAKELPEKLAQLLEIFEVEAHRNKIYPLHNGPDRRRVPILRVLSALGSIRKMTYTKEHYRMPEKSVVNLKNCSFSIKADVGIPEGGCEGVIVCQGGVMAGWSLYINKNRYVVYHYNWVGHEHYIATSEKPIEEGRHTISVDFVYEGGMGKGGDAVVSIDQKPVGFVHKNHTIPVVFSMSGETFDVGRDCGSPVGNYPHLYIFTGEIYGVTLESLTQPSKEIQELIQEKEFQASLFIQ